MFSQILSNLVDFKRIFVPAPSQVRYEYGPEYADKADKHALSKVVAEEREMVLRHVKSPGRRILDVGCNTGRSLAFFCEKWEAVGLGIDINEYAIDIAQETYPHLPFMQYNGWAFPVGPSQIDHVILHHTLAHVWSPRLIIQEICRVLKSGGTVSVITSNMWYKILQFPFNILHRFAPDTTILRHYSKRSLLRLMREHGLEAIHVDRIGITPQFCPGFLKDVCKLRLFYIGRKI